MGEVGQLLPAGAVGVDGPDLGGLAGLGRGHVENGGGVVADGGIEYRRIPGFRFRRLAGERDIAAGGDLKDAQIGLRIRPRLVDDPGTQIVDNGQLRRLGGGEPARGLFNGCSVVIAIFGRNPYFFTDNSGNAIFIHQDFSGLVTSQSPAQRGEVVTAYTLGLGGVTPSVATGVPTPLDQLYPLNWPFACYQGLASQDGPPLDVLFAGLAPGMIGIYQVNIRMPDPLPSSTSLWLNCGTPVNTDERGAAFIPIAAPGSI